MRKITREKVMKLLYSMDVYRQISKEQDLQYFLNTELGVELFEQQKKFLLNEKDDQEYLEDTFAGILKHLPEIDAKINNHTKKTWSIQQCGYVERSLLRVAMYELYWSDQEGLYPTAIIASILELSELFVDEKSTKFIHGILGAAINNIEAPGGTVKRTHQYIPLDEKKAQKNKERLKAMKAAKKARM